MFCRSILFVAIVGILVKLKFFILIGIGWITTLNYAVYSQRFQFAHYDIEDGLTNDNIRSIGQDALGQMYFGTNYGLCVYDGSVIKPFKLPGFGSDRQVLPISSLKNKKLFVSYIGNTDYFTISNGRLSDSTISGRAVIERVYDGFVPFPLLCTNQGLFKAENGKLEKIPMGLSNKDRMISALLPLNGNKLFIARKGYAPAIVSGTEFRKLTESSLNLHVNDIVRDVFGNVWLATETLGLMTLDTDALGRNQIVFKPLPPALRFLADKKEAILSFAITKDSSLLIGTADRGLIIFKKDGEVINVDYTNGLSSNRVNCVFTGRDDLIWIGTNRGVDKIVSTDVVVFGRTFDSNSDNIYTTNKDCKGRLWFFKNDYMYYIEGKEVKKITYPKDAEKIALSCANTTTGFWLSLPKRLVYIDCNYQKPYIKTVLETDQAYRRISEWEHDAILLASDEHLAIMEKGEIAVLTDSIKMIRTLLTDSFGKLWIGTFDNGLYRVSINKTGGNWTTERLYRYYDVDKTYNRYMAIAEDQSGNILAANKFHGVYVFSNAERRSALVNRLNKNNGLLNNDITSIFPHKDGTVWYGTATGISRFMNLNGNVVSRDMSSIYKIHNNVIKISQSEGSIWIATEAGLYRINEKAPRMYNVPVYFKELIFPSGGVELFSKDTLIRLKSSQNTFSINFTAPFFVNERQTEYLYRLVSENSQGKWSRIPGNKSINFSGLTHGAYILQLKATAYNNIPNSLVSSLRFYISKPFYLQAWFIILVAFLLFLLSFTIYSWRISRVKKVFNVRNAISKDLHDEIGATLSSINIYSEIAREKVNGNTEVNSLLGRIYAGSQQALESINDIVWYVDPRNDNCDNIITKMQDFAIPVLEAKGIEPVFDIQETVRGCTMSMLVRQNTYRIFREVIANIVKYSQAGKAVIRVSKSGSHVLLKIEDDGIGFDPANVKKGNGLNSMLYRALAMKAILNFDAAEGKGCKFELLCPIT